MKRPSVVLRLLSLALAACAASPERADTRVSAPVPAGASRMASAAPPPAASPAEAEAPAQQAEPAPRSPRSPGMSAGELELWNDPAFRRWFVESYVSETEIEPRITVGEREAIHEVLERVSSDEVDEALKVIRRNRGEASSAVFDFLAGNIHLERDELDQAIAAYAKAVEKYPSFRRAWQNLGVIRVRRGELREALRPLTRVIELGGGDALTYGLLGYAYSSVENSLAAETAYRTAILLDPETLDWKKGLARSLFRQERYAEAASLCRTLIDGNADSAELWLLQANAFIGMEEPMRAAENFELVDRLGGSTVESLGTLGDVYVNEGLFDMAVGAYARAMDADPEARPDRALRAAKALAARGAHDETKALVERIEAVHGDRLEDGERKDLLKLRARVAVAKGAGGEEAAILEEIVALDPLDGEALLLLGQHAKRVGDFEKAIFWFERAAGLEAFEADAKVRHAQVLVQRGKYAEAIPLLESAQSLDPRENVQEYLSHVERVAQGR